MEISRLQTQADDAERKLVGALEEIVVAKTTALVEYQSLAEFKQVQEGALMISAHSFIMFGGNNRNGTYFSSGWRPGIWSLSSMHLQRPH